MNELQTKLVELPREGEAVAIFWLNGKEGDDLFGKRAIQHLQLCKMQPLLKTTSWVQGWCIPSPFSLSADTSHESKTGRGVRDASWNLRSVLSRQELSELLRTPRPKREIVVNVSTGNLFFIVLENILHCEDKYSMLLFTASPNNHEALRLENHCSVVSSLLGTWPLLGAGVGGWEVGNVLYLKSKFDNCRFVITDFICSF